MFLHAVCLVMLASSAVANLTANVMMDSVLREMEVETRNAALDPFIMHPFAIKVKATGFTNRDFKANFTRVSLNGLGQLRRQGDCSYGAAGHELRVGCYLTLGSLYFPMDADVKGDRIIGNSHNISTSSHVPANSFLLVELQGSRNFHARLFSVNLLPLTMTTTVSSGSIDLNDVRFSDFVKQINSGLIGQLNRTLTGEYSSVLNSVASRHRIP